MHGGAPINPYICSLHQGVKKMRYTENKKIRWMLERDRDDWEKKNTH